MLKQLFCKHELEATEQGEPISLFGIALFGTWHAECRKCGIKKYNQPRERVSTRAFYKKELERSKQELRELEELREKRRLAGEAFMQRLLK